MRNYKRAAPIMLAVLIAVASVAFATPLTGTFQVTPTNTTLTFPIAPTAAEVGTYLNSMHSTYSFTAPSGKHTEGDFWAAVYRNPTGTLDFYYQVSDNLVSETAIKRIANNSFEGWDTYVAFLTNGSVLGHGFTDGTVGSADADSDAVGAVIGFNFIDAPVGFGRVVPGTVSNAVVISTNAQFYRVGASQIIDGLAVNFTTFQPGVPEPGTMTLMGLGLFAVAAFLRAGRR